MKRFVMLTVLIMAVFMVFSGLAIAKEKAKPQPDATIELKEGQVAIGIGYSWGERRADLQGEKVSRHGQRALRNRCRDHQGHSQGQCLQPEKAPRFRWHLCFRHCGRHRWRWRWCYRYEEPKRRSDQPDYNDQGRQSETCRQWGGIDAQEVIFSSWGNPLWVSSKNKHTTCSGGRVRNGPAFFHFLVVPHSAIPPASGDVVRVGSQIEIQKRKSLTGAPGIILAGDIGGSDTRLALV